MNCYSAGCLIAIQKTVPCMIIIEDFSMNSCTKTMALLLQLLHFGNCYVHLLFTFGYVQSFSLCKLGISNIRTGRAEEYGNFMVFISDDSSTHHV